MAGTFSKSILKVGTYHSPDGVVEVTPQRLKHWASETKRLQNVGYAIPSHFDHSNELDLLEPIAMDALARRQNRSAEVTVGKLADMRVAPDGQSAEIVLETLTPGATEAVSSNAVYVSPVIFPEWKDGAGNTYRDVITSFDLVDHPVDHSQSSFVPAQRMSQLVRAIRMGVNTKPFRLGPVMDEDEDNKPEDEETTSSEDGAVDSGESSESEEAPEPESQNLDDTNSQNLVEVIGALQRMNIVLPPDTSPTNFLDRLHTALLTAAAHQGLDGGDPTGDMGEGTPEAASPMIATMSVQARSAMQYAQSQYRDNIAKRLAALLRSGRCKPVEADQQKRVLSAVRLSLGKDGKPHKSEVEKWIDSREAVPKGTFWTQEQRTNAAQKLSIVEAPTSWETTGGTSKLSSKEVEAGVAALTRGRFKK